MDVKQRHRKNLAAAHFLIVASFIGITLSLPCNAQQEQVSCSTSSEGAVSIPHRLGGIRSLSRATKYGFLEIIIIGMMHSVSFKNNPLSFADDEAKKLIFEQCEVWSQQNNPVSYVLFNSPQECKIIAQLWSKENRAQGNFFPLLASFSALSNLTNCAYNNFSLIQIAPLQEYRDIEINIAFFLGMNCFRHLARQSDLPLLNVFQLDRWLEQKPLVEKKRFFSPDSAFSRFTDLVIKTFDMHNSTIPEAVLTRQKYYEILNCARDQASYLALNGANTMVRSKAEALSSQLKKSAEDAPSYLALFNCTKSNDTLVDALFLCIRSKKSFHKAVGEFASEITGPILRFKDFMEYASLVEEAYKHKRIVVFPNHDKVHSLRAFLNKAGFDVNSRGETPPFVPGQEVDVDESPFSPQTVREFLSESFGGKKRSDPYPIPQTSPLAQFVHGSDETSQSTTSHHVKGLLTENLLTRSYPSTEDTKAEDRCPQCQKPFVENIVQPNISTHTSSCYLSCFIKQAHTQFNLEALLLLTQEPLSDEEKETRKKVGALCYLRFIILSPLFCLPDTPLYSLPFEKIVEKLEALKRDEKNLAEWGQALKAAHGFLIEIDRLIIFLKIHVKLKTTFTNDLKNFRRLKNRNAVSENEKPVFDPTGQLITLQSREFESLIKVFMSKHDTPDHNFPRLYYTLLQQLLTKIPNNPEHILKPFLH